MGSDCAGLSSCYFVSVFLRDGFWTTCVFATNVGAIGMGSERSTLSMKKSRRKMETVSAGKQQCSGGPGASEFTGGLIPVKTDMAGTTTRYVRGRFHVTPL